MINLKLPLNIKKNPNILVIGDIMLDEYLWGDCNRISPEAPVPVVNIKDSTLCLGGACNVAHNLKVLGSNVSIYSVIGQDETSLKLKSILDNKNIDCFFIEDTLRTTTKKSRLMASNSQIVRYDYESKYDISKPIENTILEKLKKDINNYDLIILCDYAKGVLTSSLTKNIIDFCNTSNKKVLVDPKGSDYNKYSGAFLLTPNKNEAIKATNINIKDDLSLQKALLKLKDIANLTISLVTLSEDGIAFLDNNTLIKKPTVAKEVYDVTGAGDTVIASIGFYLALGYDIISSIEFANLAASIVVGKIGSSTASIYEIQEYQDSLSKKDISFGIKNIDEIEKIVSILKNQGKTIAFTNGCFDILHKGHISYLNKSSTFADILIVGLNSNDSVKRLKGEDRPINSQEDRAYMLSAFSFIDYVVIFNEDTPYNLISKIKPDILIKGADYKNKEVVGSNIVKTTKFVEFVEGRSSSDIINKIKKKD
jgi:D-beta-D-heptose 7-phosphate kinase / D-beta-D-heptose 1-phosphate adenosyltransferase